MAAYKTNHRGTFTIDRAFRGVGRIKRASGTKDLNTFGLINGMLDLLFNKGRLEILEAIRDGYVTPLQVFDRYQTDGLHRLPSAKTLVPLKEKYLDWVKDHEVGEAHQTALRHSLTALLKQAKGAPSVDDLPELLADYRKACKRNGTARMFNRTRSAVQAFLRSTLKKSHPLYVAVTDLAVMKIEVREGSALRPDQLHDYLRDLPVVHQRQAWAMAYSGMGPLEYWGNWSVGTDRITIRGTKRRGRNRVVPLIVPIAPPGTKYQAFRVALAKATKEAVEPYDMRRSYGHWLEEAGITDTRQALYMGHGPKTMTELYRRPEVDAYLAEDGVKLRRYLGIGEGAGLALVR